MPNQNYLSIYAKSFNWAGFFLPKEIYWRCSALYDFCRTVDNIADDYGDLNIKKNDLLNFKIILTTKTTIILSLKICGV